MNDEIKEKIYKLRAYLGTEENWLLNDIADYITNLQERIDKAIEYIYDFSLADSIILKRSYKDLLKILKGDSDE